MPLSFYLKLRPHIDKTLAEMWLDIHCKDKYAIRPIQDYWTMEQKYLIVSFNNRDDAENFLEFMNAN
jgi:hypothetical protein